MQVDFHNKINNDQIGAGCRVYLRPYYQQMGFPKGYCPEAEKYYAEAISLPMYAGLTEEQQTTVVDALQSALS